VSREQSWTEYTESLLVTKSVPPYDDDMSAELNITTSHVHTNAHTHLHATQSSGDIPH